MRVMISRISVIIVSLFCTMTIALPALTQERDIGQQLFTAIRNKDYNRIEELVRKGVKVNANVYGKIIFHWAIDNASTERDLDMIKLFIRNGADVNSVSESSSHTPLIRACKGILSNNYTVRFELVKLLVNKRARVNYENSFGQTALRVMVDTFPGKKNHALAHDEALRILEYLIKKGGDVNQKSKEGGYPFDTALWKGSPELVEVLYKAGARIRDKNCSPLHLVVTTGYYPKEKVTVLTNQGLDINARDGMGRTPFIRAVFNYPETALFLLEKGANINSKDENGDSALLFLLKISKQDMEHGNHGYLLHKVRTIQLLLDHGADVNAANRLGETPLSVVERMKYIAKRNRSLAAKYNSAILKIETMLSAKGARREKGPLFNADDFKDAYLSWNFKCLSRYMKGSVKYQYTDEATGKVVVKTLGSDEVMKKLRFFRGKKFTITSWEDLSRGSEEVKITLDDPCKGKRCPRFVSDLTLKLIIKDGKLLIREMAEYRSDTRGHRGV